MENHSPQRRGFTMRTTKFRHLKGAVLGRETHITNITAMSKTIAGECEPFKVNHKFAALPVGPNCSQLAVIHLSHGMRLSGGVIPSLMIGHVIADFAFDPFNDNRIAVACDDGSIQLWLIPEEGLQANTDEFSAKMSAHSDRLSIIQFHPIACDVLASFAMDLTLLIWDLKLMEAKICITTHNESLFGMSWSADGTLLATFCRDQRLRVFDVRDNGNLVKEGEGPQGTRGGRVCWAQKGKVLIVTGFSRVSERQFMVYDYNDISKPIASEGLDVSPAILTPFYDEDSCTLFLTGKGDSTIWAFEISLPEEGVPYIHSLSHFSIPSPHQSVSFLQKRFCDVRNVEFARGYRLTSHSIEPISFSVPRLRNEYFQDDLFPPTKDTSKYYMTSDEWFSGVQRQPDYVSLQPTDMTPLSDAPPLPKRENHNANVQIVFEGDIALENPLSFINVGREQREMIVQQMSDKVEYNDNKLPQDSYEGVDPNEWDE